VLARPRGSRRRSSWSVALGCQPWTTILPEPDRTPGFQARGQDMDESTALMQRAIDAARLGPQADPNPRVGCVVTDAAGRVVGVGHHRGAGTAHAEVDALAQAGGGGPRAAPPTSPSNRATTPDAPARAPAPCSRRASPGSSSPSGTPTRSPRVGAATLAAAGVAVETGVLREAAEGTQRVVAARPPHRPPVRHRQERLDPRRSHGPPPMARVAGSPARQPAPTCTTCARGAAPSSSAPAPP
jgi:diaminohydroxyphosphoribosylaminopyrimidine deaminase/5-amino-6-(5-phosphoribosylamino)uracil reductase